MKNLKNRMKIYYVGDKSHNSKIGVMTVATEVQEDGKTVQIGFAFSSPKDQFSRKVGREKAIGRMRSEKYSYNAPFTGHSSDSIAHVFNQYDFPDGRKPHNWRKGKLVNCPQAKGLVFLKHK